MKFKQIYILYSNLHIKDRHSVFLKEILTQMLFKIPLWSEIDNVTYFVISSKNLKALYLTIHWSNDSRTRGFELVSRRFELVTRGFQLVTHRFELVTCGFEHITQAFELVTRGFELVTREFELLNQEFQLVTCGFKLVNFGFELVTRGFELVNLNS